MNIRLLAHLKSILKGGQINLGFPIHTGVNFNPLNKHIHYNQKRRGRGAIPSKGGVGYGLFIRVGLAMHTRKPVLLPRLLGSLLTSKLDGNDYFSILILSLPIRPSRPIISNIILTCRLSSPEVVRTNASDSAL
jgi:hypothetical protein